MFIFAWKLITLLPRLSFQVFIFAWKLITLLSRFSFQVFIFAWKLIILLPRLSFQVLIFAWKSMVLLRSSSLNCVTLAVISAFLSFMDSHSFLTLSKRFPLARLIVVLTFSGILFIPSPYSFILSLTSLNFSMALSTCSLTSLKALDAFSPNSLILPLFLSHHLANNLSPLLILSH